MRSAGAPNADLEIVVSANGGQIDGSVENDKSEPVDHALVTLVPPDRRAISASMDQNRPSPMRCRSICMIHEPFP